VLSQVVAVLVLVVGYVHRFDTPLGEFLRRLLDVGDAKLNDEHAGTAFLEELGLGVGVIGRHHDFDSGRR
jgi:hypothetical protein